METAINYVQNKYKTSRHLLKPGCTTVWNVKVKKSAFALPIRDDKAMPNFYHKFVNC